MLTLRQNALLFSRAHGDTRHTQPQIDRQSSAADSERWTTSNFPHTELKVYLELGSRAIVIGPVAEDVPTHGVNALKGSTARDR